MYERKPGWFPLIARSASPTGLLSLRYIDGIDLDGFLLATRGSDENKVMAGGTPANPATLVTQDERTGWFPRQAQVN